MNDITPPLRTPEPGIRATLAERQQRLEAARQQLKTELLGIDDVIDRVVDAVRAWYVLPQLCNRPVIVCLWGLTGTGKTQLIRRLAQLLEFYDRFVEVQMDGFSNGAGFRSSTLSGMLENSGIQESAPGILVLDEFQRFRTIDRKGEDVKVERYQDVWALLSDGRLPPPLSALGTIERKLAEADYEAEREDDEGERAGKKPYQYRLDAWDAQELKRMLKLNAPLVEIMQWPSDQVQALIRRFQQSSQAWETDYSRLLVFVCGNLDEMYQETAQRVQDCDTDADIFHRLTRRLSLIDVKGALCKRFKPEQIARLGNEHVIYPSLSRSTYERLIQALCERYTEEVLAQTGVRLALTPAVRDELYANAVFPTQGTRPLFSAVHAILSANLIKASLWVLEQGLALDQVFEVSLDDTRRHLIVKAAHTPGAPQTRLPVHFELNHIKQRANADFRALLAVHEAGHGLIYSLLFAQAPQEIKINLASFEGGYNSYVGLKVESRQNLLDRICVSLAGREAERLVFGDSACTTGAEQDHRHATESASRFIRLHGFGDRISVTDVTVDMDNHVNTDMAPSNRAIETLLQAQRTRACQLLQQNRQALGELVDGLLSQGMLSPQEVRERLLPHGIALRPCAADHGEALVLEPYADQLATFRASASVPVGWVTIPVNEVKTVDFV
jgi:hypothetical protein